jgi:hypothetical protein
MTNQNRWDTEVPAKNTRSNGTRTAKVRATKAGTAKALATQAGATKAWMALLLLMMVAAPSPLLGQERIDERRPLAADGRVDLAVVSHGVRVEAWDRNEVHLTGTLDPNTQRLEVRGDEGSLRIHIEHQRDVRNPYAGSLELRIPRGARVSVATISGDLQIQGTTGAVRANSVSGSIQLDGSPSTAELQTVSGGIVARGTVGDLRLQTVSGNVRVSGSIERFEAQSVSGRIEMEGSGSLQRVRANSVSGPIRIAGPLADGAGVELESHGGAVTLQVPRDTSADYELTSFSGAIRNRLTEAQPGSERWSNTLRFTVGQGSSRVRINSFSGGITVEPLG